MFINVFQTVNGKVVTTKQTVGGLLYADCIMPHQVSNRHGLTPAREIYQLMVDGDEAELEARLNEAFEGTKQAMIGILAQWPQLRQKNKSVVRKALRGQQALATTEKPAAEIKIEVSIVDVADDEKWATVLAVTTDGTVIAEIANGLVFNPHAKSKVAKLGDTQVSSVEEAIDRFSQQFEEPAPGLVAALKVIRKAVDNGEAVRLIAPKATQKQAHIVADAVRKMPATTVAPRSTHQNAHPAVDSRYHFYQHQQLAGAQGPVQKRTEIYPVHVGINDADEAQVEPTEAPWRYTFEQGSKSYTLLTQPGEELPLQGNVRNVYAPRKVRHIFADGAIEEKTIEVRTTGLIVDDQLWWVQPGTATVREGEAPVTEPSTVTSENVPDWKIVRSRPLTYEEMAPTMYDWMQSHIFEEARRIARHIERVKRQTLAAMSDLNSEFVHHTRRPDGTEDGALHSNDTNNGRFDRHDAMLDMTPEEAAEQDLIIEMIADEIFDGQRLTSEGMTANTARFLAEHDVQPAQMPQRNARPQTKAKSGQTPEIEVEERTAFTGEKVRTLSKVWSRETLDPVYVRQHTTVRDCIITQGENAYVLTASAQIAGKKPILVWKGERRLSIDEQKAANNNRYWGMDSTSGTERTYSGVYQMQTLKNNGQVTRPQPWASTIQAGTRTTFEPGNQAWHDVLTDDNVMHLITWTETDVDVLLTKMGNLYINTRM